MLHASFTIIKSWKVIAVIISLTLLAVGEATSERTLIVISVIGSITTLIAALISAAVSVINSRKLNVVATLPQKVEEFRKEVDGRMTELRESRMQTSEAKQEVARGEGVQQEREEERARRQEEPRPPTAATGEAAKIEIVNPKNRPVPTVPGEKSKPL